MKRSIRTSLKALFLLVVFFLNTAVGFACSLNADLMFNKHHSESHDHAKPHRHHAELPGECQSSKQVSLTNHRAHNKHKDNCCSDEVLKLEKTDKLIDASTLSITPFNGAYTVFYAAFYDFRTFELTTGNSNGAYFVHHYHPPIPDIRIAIQSFQI